MLPKRIWKYAIYWPFGSWYLNKYAKRNVINKLKKVTRYYIIVLGLALNNINENMKTVMTAKDTELIKCLGKVKETLTVKAKGTHSGE